MKTTGLPSQNTPHAHNRSHSRSSSQSLFANKQATNTPISSPRAPHSVGQPYTPKLSPGAHRPVSHDNRTPSPNYFGLSIEPAGDPRDSCLLPRDNWSPPSSSVKSFAAALPKPLPLDANPEFEAFRRQADLNRGRPGFNLSASPFALNPVAGHTPLASTPSALQRPRPPRWHTQGSDGSDGSIPRPGGPLTGLPRTRDSSGSGSKQNGDNEGSHDSAYGSADSKRNSEASLHPPPLFLNLGRQESPAQLEASFHVPERGRSNLSVPHDDEPYPRPFSSQGRANQAPMVGLARQQPRAETEPPKLESGGPGMMSPGQLRDLMEGEGSSGVLILDLRVSPQFAQSRVKGALNLCIPTTLLKRATYNLQKLQQSFQAEQDQEKFSKWHDFRHLVVYDASSSDKRDAVSALNMIKKFSNEGYLGSTNILRGGFNAFSAAYPELIDRTSGRGSPGLSLGGSVPACRSNVPPVIGGVLLPQTSNPNPFFSNIRQNQDLVDGVGQMDISVPPNLDQSRLPQWLREAADAGNHGKKVSEKFLRIELAEQSRMKDAYSVSTAGLQGKKAPGESKVQLSGIEQGVKNRYKDILPFEHARVRLLGRPVGACDYVNASHIQASRSHKQYIASQGPLPATFEDFWSVIWDQDVRVIVMLTAESEGGQLKCHPYWKGRDFGPIKLRVMSEKKISLDIDKHRSDSTMSPDPVSRGTDAPASVARTTPQGEHGRRRANTTTTLGIGSPAPAQAAQAGESPYVIIRKFALSHASHPFSPIREITQLHYPSWPDFGAPAKPGHLLALVELANMMQHAALPMDVGSLSRQGSFGSAPGSEVHRKRVGNIPNPVSGRALSWHDEPESGENNRPMLVHCSAGCGRTGAFCTVDSVIDMLKRQRLRAAQRANKRIHDRERQLAQLSDQTRAKRPALHRDSDGDLSMADDIDPLATLVDPAAAALIESMASSQPTTDGDKTSDEGDIDTSWLDDETIDLIAKTVEDFRGQRLSMVQSLRQFVLCYETIIEWVWRLQERAGGSDVRGRARSGSLAV
ncbi:hypothetical protein OQA88_11507 [Cercophora sp. LCS_1]